MKATAAYTVEFRTERAPTPDPVGRVPRVARLLALAHRIDTLVQAGELRDLAHAAEVSGLTRARITEVSNLLLLAPDIQAAILDLPLITSGRDSITERNLRPIVAEPNWTHQIAMWQRLHQEIR